MAEKHFKARILDEENAYIEIDGVQCYIEPCDIYHVESKLNELYTEKAYIEVANEIHNDLEDDIQILKNKIKEKDKEIAELYDNIDFFMDFVHKTIEYYTRIIEVERRKEINNIKDDIVL